MLLNWIVMIAWTAAAILLWERHFILGALSFAVALMAGWLSDDERTQEVANISRMVNEASGKKSGGQRSNHPQHREGKSLPH
jgi:hypothetical protein